MVRVQIACLPEGEGLSQITCQGLIYAGHEKRAEDDQNAPGDSTQQTTLSMGVKRHLAPGVHGAPPRQATPVQRQALDA